VDEVRRREWDRRGRDGRDDRERWLKDEGKEKRRRIERWTDTSMMYNCLASCQSSDA
jgi:hypothetical protein